VLHYLSVTGQFSEFVKGVIDTRALAYFVSLIGAALFLTHRSVESLRWR
jgi:ABC-2 type transport system permease protein